MNAAQYGYVDPNILTSDKIKSSVAKVTYSYLSHLWQATNKEVMPGINNISNILNSCKNTAINGLNELRKKRLINSKHRYRTSGALVGKRTTNQYYISYIENIKVSDEEINVEGNIDNNVLEELALNRSFKMDYNLIFNPMYNGKLKSNDKLILMLLHYEKSKIGNKQEKTKKVRISLHKLKQLSRLSKTTIQKCIKKLNKVGVITTISRVGNYGIQYTNEYALETFATWQNKIKRALQKAKEEKNKTIEQLMDDDHINSYLINELASINSSKSNEKIDYNDDTGGEK